MLDDVLPPPLGVGVAGSGGEFAQRVGRCRLGDERGVVIASAAASVTASGRSIACTSTSWALAQAIACHSGLNVANGANAARPGSAGT